MSVENYLRIGETITLGSHTFTSEEIKAFASKYDPQHFHVDEAAAESSVFGRLCASGWHSCAVWMKLNLKEYRQTLDDLPWSGPGPRPQFGPSPGITNLRWLKPVYAGDRVTFARRATGYRPLASRPGWGMMAMVAEAFNDAGEKVLEFENSVLVKVA
jgi:acyl dehydratase